jgi:glycosyltransferase involved in cell wall biosynthesis
MSDHTLITTIIPTLCEATRSDSLIRAIESIHRASERRVRVLIVVNGQRFDRGLLDSLQARQDVNVIQIEEGSLVRAHHIGRQAVDTEYFSFLDDDDEYLPRALDVRMGGFEKAADVDLVVTNGWLSGGATERPCYSRMARVESNPVEELLYENWLHNCNHLFRSSSVGVGYFEDPHAYLEWTWLRFKLGIDGKRVVALDVPTFRYYDTPGSLSKSSRSITSRIAIYDRMLSVSSGSKLSDMIRRRSCSAWHDMSVHELDSGNKAKAIRAHLRSLTTHWSGLKFLSYSRHLI